MLTLNIDSDIVSDQNRYIDPNELTTDFNTSSVVNTYCLLINMPIKKKAKPTNAFLGPYLLAMKLQNFGAKVDILDM